MGNMPAIMRLRVCKVLSLSQIDFFTTNGYLVLPGAGQEALPVLQQEAQQQLRQLQAPLELEAEVGYPGAPNSLEQPGGKTVRRLLQAAQRSAIWHQWAVSKQAKSWLGPLLNEDASANVWLNPNHHNCLMAKSPKYSSDTGWHQDVRYWQFNHAQLVSIWLALGNERSENGGLQVIPGSHVAQFSADQFDTSKFFRCDLAENQTWLDGAISVDLNAGDVLLFDSRLLHKASRNHSDKTKMSLVFTYHGEGNYPVAGSRSAALAEVKL